MKPTKWYSTKEAAKAAHTTERVLQWWDETEVVVPSRFRFRRAYSPTQIEQIKRLLHLREDHRFPLKDAQELLAYDLPVRVITGPTVIGGELIVPRRKK